jgi:Carbohydrate family 9 binding domain-like
MLPLLALLFFFAAAVDVSAVLESAYAKQDFDLTADPSSPQWAKAPRVAAGRDYLGRAIAGAPTEIRSRWTKQNLYLLYICPYDELNLKPDPDPSKETPQLWNWEVAEAFIGSDYAHTGRYKEFQVSPQSEWVDLDIDRENQQGQQGMKWNSGYTVKGRIDAQAKIWYGEMRIPFAAIDTRAPQKGRELRIGLYRIAGLNPKKYFAWRPTGSTSFHVPQAFGTLRLR